MNRFRTQEDTTFKMFCEWFNFDPLDFLNGTGYKWHVWDIKIGSLPSNNRIKFPIKPIFIENFNITTGFEINIGKIESFLDYL